VSLDKNSPEKRFMTLISQIDPSLKIALDELVNKPYKQHRNSVWIQEVIKTNNHYQRHSILDRGRADFTISSQGLTPEQKVLLYCCHYLPMHLASHRYLYDVCQSYSKKHLSLLTDNSILIDFGCGPLTAALSLANYSLQNRHTSLNCHYIGIDRAPAMLTKAEQFSQHSRLFSPQSQFRFFNDNHNEQAIIATIQNLSIHLSNPCLLFNFSYLFASHWLCPSAMANFVNAILDYFPKNPCFIFFQNPPGLPLNRNWLIFKNRLEFPLSVIGQSSIADGKIIHYSDYFMQSNSFCYQNKTIKLYYEILAT
jgi:hypothetical protein